MSRNPSAQLHFTILVLASTLFSGGCASVYNITIDATARGDGVAPGGASFRIEEQNAITGMRTLRHNEIANHIKTALSAQGLYEAPNAQSADMVVEISYGIGPPRREQTVHQELVGGRPVTATESQGLPPEGVVTREMMGYTLLTTSTVVREKHLSIRARENAPRESTQPPEDIWRVHVSVENESMDLRGHLPVLAAAAMDHLGQTTDGRAALTLRSDDEAVRFIRKGL